MADVRVVLKASDRLLRSGLAEMISLSPGLLPVDAGSIDGADVVVLAQRKFSRSEVAGIAGEKGLGLPPILLIVDSLTAAQLADCVHRNVVSVLPHSACTPAALSEHIRVTADGGSLIPPALLAELLRQSHAEPTDGGPERQLTERDITVLQLLADGADTQGIAEHLNCSERTAKHITATINRRLRARNRPHAVALAIRTGIL